MPGQRGLVNEMLMFEVGTQKLKVEIKQIFTGLARNFNLCVLILLRLCHEKEIRFSTPVY